MKLAGVGLALGLLVTSTEAQEMQWRPAPASSMPTAAAPAVTLRAPVADGPATNAASVQQTSYSSSLSSTALTARGKLWDGPPQPLPVGPSLKTDNPSIAGPPLKGPGPVAEETWGNEISTWHGGMPCGDAIGAPVPLCCDDVSGCCGLGGWWCWGKRLFTHRECCDICCDGCCPPRPCFWARGEYLLWTVKDAPLPPLVTVNNIPGAPPVLGMMGTGVAIGGHGEDYDIRSGGRFTLGFGLPCLGNMGFETTYFFLASRTTSPSVNSGGVPGVGRPFTEVGAILSSPGNQQAQLVAFPGVVAGRVVVAASNDLWGIEANFRNGLCCGCNYRVDFLWGFRHLTLTENVNITEDLRNISQPIAGSTSIGVSDRFFTRNEFYGGQVGIDGEYRWRGWFVGGNAKLAAGTMHQHVVIDGTTVFRDGLMPAIVRGGLLALPGTNIGTYNRDTFALVPELGVKLGYNFTEHLRGYVGYDVVYASSVVRPGDQIDTNVNSSFLPRGGSPAGAPLPRFIFRSTDFWAQGVNFGLEVRY
jgi:hypothetical protein